MERGGLGFARGEPIRLRAIAHRDIVTSLQETPLGKDQRVSPHDGEHEMLGVTVPDTMELRGWLLSYGPLIEVLQPEGLREDRVTSIEAMARSYGVVRPPPRRAPHRQ